MLARAYQRGDTLIEVLFAFAVFSLIVVGALSLMNQGTVAAQRALETSLVRSEIDAQATTIRFLHDAYVAHFQPGATYGANTPAGQWVKMTEITRSEASAFGGVSVCDVAAPEKSFILNAVTAKYHSASSKFEKATNIAKVNYESNTLTNSQGVWVEAVRSAGVDDSNLQNTSYIDFHIRACWDSPGQGLPMTLGTIVRLYEPRG